jgi:hypothetical protein
VSIVEEAKDIKKTSITIALDGMKESSSIVEKRPQWAGRRTGHTHTPFQPLGTGVKGPLKRVYHYHLNHAKQRYLKCTCHGYTNI